MANEQRLIDVNAMHKFVEDMVAKKEGAFANGVPYEWAYALTAVDMQPTVDAVPVVHGRWEDGCAIHNGKEVYKSIDCSVCKEVFKIESETREYWKNRFKVCPFCGAKMDGGNEDV